MTKPLDPVVATEFKELKSFLCAFMDLAEGRSAVDVSQLSTAMDEMEQRAPKRALAGLRMAVNDCVEMSSDWSAERVKSIDAAMAGAGALTLSEARRKFTKKVAGILSRGRIRSEVEYYIVAGLLADVSSGSSAEERSRLQTMAEAYEESR